MPIRGNSRGSTVSTRLVPSAFGLFEQSAARAFAVASATNIRTINPIVRQSMRCRSAVVPGESLTGTMRTLAFGGDNTAAGRQILEVIFNAGAKRLTARAMRDVNARP